MTEKEYRSHPAISRSELWVIDESPEKFKWFKDHPVPPTPALVFGQIVHKLLLQPTTFADEFAVAPNVNRRSKAGKEEYDAFLAANEGKTVIDEDDFDVAVDMVNKIIDDPACKSLITGEHEVPLFWTDPDTGEYCKCRLDALTYIDGKPFVVDYKTASSVRTDIFNNVIYKYGYHFQAAMYSEGVMRSMGLSERPGFIFIAQEKKPPYSINRVLITDDVMTAGVDKFRELIGIYHSCKEMNYWYGYNGISNELNESYLPGWMSLGEEEDE